VSWWRSFSHFIQLLLISSIITTFEIIFTFLVQRGASFIDKGLIVTHFGVSFFSLSLNRLILVKLFSFGDYYSGIAFFTIAFGSDVFTVEPK
jgi:hypothetical protein